MVFIPAFPAALGTFLETFINNVDIINEHAWMSEEFVLLEKDNVFEVPKTEN